jgi:phosphate transport system substrate-binding protein
MNKLRKQDTSLATLALLLAIAAAPKPVVAQSVAQAALAQATLAQATLAQAAFPAPATVPQGTTVKINGSTSMTAINQALSDRFQAKFPGTQVSASYGGSDAALQAVLDGKVDLAAIGRPLTDAEKAKGLVALPVARHKIAVIVAASNAFTKSLTGEEFSAIFRGEITDWSQLGGEPLPIQLIDRPENSDTRRAFARYPVFQAAPFQSGSTAVKLETDSTDSMLQKLGDNGIGYAIADQVVNNPAVRVVPMYGALPNEASYPFSQPLSYVYNGAAPSAAAQAFLGFAATPDNQSPLETARVAAATAPAANPEATNPEAASGAANSGAASPEAAASAPASPDGGASPAGSPSDAVGSPLAASPSATSPSASASPAAPQAGEASGMEDGQAGELGGGLLARWWWLLPVLGSLGVLVWLLRGRSPAGAAGDTTARASEGFGDLGEFTAPPGGVSTVGTGAVGAGAIGAGAVGMAAAGAGAVGMAAAGAADTDLGVAAVPHNSRIVLTPRNCRDAYAYWEVTDAHRTLLKQQGGNQLTLRLYDVTDIDLYYQAPHSVHEFLCGEDDQDLQIPIPTDNRDYLVELGYTTADHRWLPLARSLHVRVPACTADDPAADANRSNGIRIDPAAGDRTYSSMDVPSVDAPPADATLPAVSAVSQSAGGDRPTSRLILVPRSAEDLYAYWEIPDAQKQALQQQGKQRLILRIYDITDVNLNSQPPRNVQQFECDADAKDRHVSVPAYGDYIATLGYLTAEGRWHSIARSTPVRIRAAGSSSLPQERI